MFLFSFFLLLIFTYFLLWSVAKAGAERSGFKAQRVHTRTNARASGYMGLFKVSYLAVNNFLFYNILILLYFF